MLSIRAPDSGWKAAIIFVIGSESLLQEWQLPWSLRKRNPEGWPGTLLGDLWWLGPQLAVPISLPKLEPRFSMDHVLASPLTTAWAEVSRNQRDTQEVHPGPRFPLLHRLAVGTGYPGSK